MKILKENLYLPNIQKYQTNIIQTNSKKLQENSLQNFPKGDFYRVNFEGNQIPIGLISDLKKLDNVPCPCCGLKMLSAETFNKYVKSFENVKTASDLDSILLKIKDNIHPNFSELVKNIEVVIRQNPMADSDFILKKMEDLCNEKSNNEMIILKNKLLDLKQNNDITSEKKSSISLALKKIEHLDQNVHRRNFYKHICIILKECLENFGENERYYLYKNFNENIKKSFINEYLFLAGKNVDRRITEAFLENILSYSKSDVHKIYDKVPLGKENIILTCNGCSYNRKTIHSKSNNKQNYCNYIYTLSQRALDNLIPSQKDYPILVQNYVKKCSKNFLQVNNLQEDFLRLLNDPEVRKLHEQGFPIVYHDGIFCANCGQKTISHNKKNDIILQIHSAENLKEILAILNQYKDSIKPKYLNILQGYEEQISKFPQISDAKLMKHLKWIAYKDLKLEIEKSILMLKSIMQTQNLSRKEKYAVDIFVYNLEKMLASNSHTKSFSADFYKKEFEKMIQQFTDNPKLYDIMTNEVFVPTRTAYSVHRMLFPSNDVIMKVGSIPKIMAENIIARSLATIDHLVPKILYREMDGPIQFTKFQSNRKCNLVVMCKECNSNKGAKDLEIWMNENPNMKENLQKYLTQVENLQKKGIFDKEYLFYSGGVKAFVKKKTGIEL